MNRFLVATCTLVAVALSSAPALADLATVQVNDAFYGVQDATIASGATGASATTAFDIASFGESHGPVEIEFVNSGGSVIGDITNFGVAGEGYDGFLLSVVGSGDPALGTTCTGSSTLACISISYGTAVDIDPVIGDLTGRGILEGGTADITLLRPTNVPEPASLALLGAGLTGFAALRRRRRTARPN